MSTTTTTTKTYKDAHQRFMEEFLQSGVRNFLFLRNGSSGEIDFDAVDQKLMSEIRAYFSAVGRMPPDMFDLLLGLLEAEWVLMRQEEDDEKNDDALALGTLKVYALSQCSQFVSDPRFVIFMRAVAEETEEGNSIFDAEDHLFVKGSDRADGGVLRKGFSIKHLPVFQRLIQEDKLWKGLGMFFFDSVAEALSVMSRDHPRETLRSHILFLQQICKLEGDHMVRMDAIDSLCASRFDEQGRRALQKLIRKDPFSLVAHYAELILERSK